MYRRVLVICLILSGCGRCPDGVPIEGIYVLQENSALFPNDSSEALVFPQFSQAATQIVVEASGGPPKTLTFSFVISGETRTETWTYESPDSE